MKLEQFILKLKEANPKEKYLWITILIYAQHLEQISVLNIATQCKLDPACFHLVLNKRNTKISFEKFDLKVKITGTILYLDKTPIVKEKKISYSNKIFIENVLNTLNKITGKKYRYSSPKNKTVILARIAEGYSFEEFLHAMQVQSIKLLGTENELFLRPETLFGTKMEGYVNTPIPKSNPNANKLEKINEAITRAKRHDWENAPVSS